MSPGTIGLIVLFVGSELIGLALGQWFFGLFMKAMPVGATSSFNEGAAHLAFLLYGAGAGLVIFLWATLASAIARMLKRVPKPGPTASTTAKGAPPPGSP